MEHRTYSFSDESSIPGRDQILAGEEKGWEVFCEFLTELSRHLLKKKLSKKFITGLVADLSRSFMKNQGSLENLQNVVDLKKYVVTSSKNKKKAEYRRKKRRREEVFDPKIHESHPIFQDNFANPEHIVSFRELLMNIARAMQKIPKAYSKALFDFAQGYSHSEIAYRSEIKNVSSVGQHLNRARRALIKQLSNEIISNLEDVIPELSGRLSENCA